MKIIKFEKDFKFKGRKFKKGQKEVVTKEIYEEMIEKDPEIVGKEKKVEKKVKKVKAKVCETC